MVSEAGILQRLKDGGEGCLGHLKTTRGSLGTIDVGIIPSYKSAIRCRSDLETPYIPSRAARVPQPVARGLPEPRRTVSGEFFPLVHGVVLSLRLTG